MNALSPQLSYYRPSGVAPIGGVLATFVMGAVGGVALAAVYGFANHHDPIIYLNVALAIGFGWALGWLVSKGVRTFHIRNAVVASAVGLAAFSVAYAAHWVVYISTVLVDSSDEVSFYDVGLILKIASQLVQEPKAIWRFIQDFNKSGIWSFTSSYSSRSKGVPIKGIFLVIIWLTEALAILWFTVTKAWDEANRPYSERQGKWLAAQTLPARVAFIEDVEGFKNALGRGDFSALTTPLPAEEAQGAKFTTVTLFPDSFEPYVTVQNALKPDAEAWKKSKKPWWRRLSWGPKTSKTTTTYVTIVKYLKISPTIAQNISSALSTAAH